MQINTKLVMSVSAIFLGVLGLGLTFLPKEAAVSAGLPLTPALLLLLQVLGALYFSFAMINYMAKGAAIGGIYNKPILMGNLTHFVVGALTLIKASTGAGNLPFWVFILAGGYCIFALVFGVMFFRNPTAEVQPA